MKQLIGGRSGKSQWWYLDEELKIQGFRVFIIEENGERYWAADFKILGEIPKAYQCVRLIGIEPNITEKGRACVDAKKLLRRIPVPSPQETST